MSTHSVVPSKGQMPAYRWQPLSYLLFFGGVLLICLWAEVNRRQQLPNTQSVCSCISVISPLTTGCSPVRAAPKPSWFRDVKKPLFRPCDHIPAENLKPYG